MSTFITSLDNFFNTCTGFLFGPIMLVVFFGTGLLMTIVTRGVQFRKFGTAVREVVKNIRDRKANGDGQLRPFQALATALSSCVGNGNVVGVSAALVSGGPGAIFWMWIAAITGMATKYSEIMLAMHFREKDDKGIWRGGVMYILTRGMGEQWKILSKFLGGVLRYAACWYHTYPVMPFRQVPWQAFSIPPCRLSRDGPGAYSSVSSPESAS